MKLSRFLTVLFVGIIVFVTSESGSAYIVTVHVEGIVSSVETGGGLTLDGSVIVGSTVMEGYYTYDTETPDQDPQYDWVSTYSVLSISMTVGSYMFLPDPAGSKDPWFYISTWTDSFYYSVISPEALFYGPCYLNGQPTTLEDLNLSVRGISWSLRGDNDGTITDALPDENTFPDLSVFTEEKLLYVANDSSPWVSIASDITSLTVVPEPASVLLFGLAGLALLRKRKK